MFGISDFTRLERRWPLGPRRADTALEARRWLLRWSFGVIVVNSGFLATWYSSLMVHSISASGLWRPRSQLSYTGTTDLFLT